MAGISTALEKFFTNDRIMIFAVFGILVVFLLWYSGNKHSFMDNMDSPYGLVKNHDNIIKNYGSPPDPDTVTSDTIPHVATSSQPVVIASDVQNGYSSVNTNDPSELLPHDTNSELDYLNPISNTQGGAMIPDLLQAGYHIGLDTVGQTMKNANLQLRSDPYIQKTIVGPWNQSTVEPDVMRVPLEVGVGLQ